MNRAQAANAQYYARPCLYNGLKVYIWELTSAQPSRACISQILPVAVKSTRDIQFEWVGIEELEVANV